MADLNKSQVRQLCGQFTLRWQEFRLAEASVADGTAMLVLGPVGGAQGLPEPVAGYIVGMAVGSEASAAYGVTPSVDTVDAAAAYDVAVAGAEAYVVYNTPLAFAAGEVLGINVEGTVTTAKDIHAALLVVSDWDS